MTVKRENDVLPDRLPDRLHIASRILGGLQARILLDWTPEDEIKYALKMADKLIEAGFVNCGKKED